MAEKKKIDLTIDILTAQELEKKGNLKFMSYAGIDNYIAIYDHRHYVLRTDTEKKYYELLNRKN